MSFCSCARPPAPRVPVSFLFLAIRVIPAKATGPAQLIAARPRIDTFVQRSCYVPEQRDAVKSFLPIWLFLRRRHFGRGQSAGLGFGLQLLPARQHLLAERVEIDVGGARLLEVALE